LKVFFPFWFDNPIFEEKLKISLYRLFIAIMFEIISTETLFLFDQILEEDSEGISFEKFIELGLKGFVHLRIKDEIFNRIA
jgi:hypothetical protein